MTLHGVQPGDSGIPTQAAPFSAPAPHGLTLTPPPRWDPVPAPFSLGLRDLPVNTGVGLDGPEPAFLSRRALYQTPHPEPKAESQVLQIRPRALALCALHIVRATQIKFGANLPEVSR